MIINQTLQDFRSYINTHRGIAKSNRFVVELLDPNLIRRTKFYGSRGIMGSDIYNGDTRTTQQHLEFSARSTSLPSKTISTNAVEAPGPEQKYPYSDVYDDLTITFMATQGKEHPYGIPEKRFFDAWMNIVVNPENMLVNYSKLYATNGLHISMINEKNVILAKYRFDRAYPIGMGAVELGHDSEEASTFEVTFSVDRWHYVTDTTKLEVEKEEGEASTKRWNPKILPPDEKGETKRSGTLLDADNPYFVKPETNNNKLKTTSDSGAIPKRWNPKFASYPLSSPFDKGPALPNQTAERGTLLESNSPFFIKPKTSGEPLERASNLAGKAAGKADQLASKVGVRMNPSRKVARTLAVAKKLKRFV
jgi:hypothetical protein